MNIYSKCEYCLSYSFKDRIVKNILFNDIKEGNLTNEDR